MLATIKKIMPYGAFCTLDEYEGKEAFLHISEVAPRWIKNIHEFLYEGQKIVAKVYRLVPEKEQIDISLKRVSDAERKRKLEEVRRAKRGEKLFEVAVREGKIEEGEAIAIREKLLGKFGELLTAFEEISAKGEKAVEDIRLPKDFLKSIVEVARRNIKKARAEVKETVSLTCYAPNGIEVIKEIFSKIKAKEGVEISVGYLGAPRYQITAIGDDFKSAEKAVEDVAAQISELGKGREISFERLKA